MLYCQLENKEWLSVKYLSLEKRSIEENVWKALDKTIERTAPCL
jgi:hypothetical protein